MGEGEGEGEFSKRIKRRTEEQREGAAIFFFTKGATTTMAMELQCLRKKRTIFLFFILKGKR